MHLTLPVPPLLNRLYRVSGSRIYKDPKAQKYKHDVWMLCVQQGVKRLQGSLAMQISWYRQRKKGDVDGILKCLLDSLESVAYENDSQIKRLCIEKFDDKLDPRLEITITEIAGTSPTP